MPAFLLKKLQNAGCRPSADQKCHTSVLLQQRNEFTSPEDLVCSIFAFCVLIFRFDVGFNAEVAAILFSISLHSLGRGTCTLRLLFCVVDVFLLNSTSHSVWKHKFTLCTFIIQTPSEGTIYLCTFAQRQK